jgi:hypothetical protein
MLWKAMRGRFDGFTDNDWPRFYRVLLFVPIVVFAILGSYGAWLQ